MTHLGWEIRLQCSQKTALFLTLVQQTLQTMVGAKTLALDTKTNHLLTMAAEFGPPAPNAKPGPAGRPPRGPMIPDSFSILMIGK